MRIAYCGFDFFSACLKGLVENAFNVYRVYTKHCDNASDYNQYVYEIAEHENIPISEQRIDAATIEQLQKEGCELLITAAYPYRVPDLTGTGIKAINVHPTLLPQGRGAAPIPWMILKNLQQGGVTIHKHTQEYDAGDILLQRSFDIRENETNESLCARSQMLARDMLLDVVKDFERYWVEAKPQVGSVDVWPVPQRQDRTLDWNKTVAEIDRVSRAFSKSGSFASFDENSWKVFVVNTWQVAHDYTPGEVVHKTNTEMIVAAADGLVDLLFFQPE